MDYMRHSNSRTVKVNKEKLIKQIKENKSKHIEEYEKAVIAYKEEASKQLSKLTDDINQGKLGIELKLVKPINNSENYDKIIEMFEWEVEDYVELTQNEFNEYVQDETETSRQAKMSNMFYNSPSFMD
jgi:hypothetical protein